MTRLALLLTRARPAWQRDVACASEPVEVFFSKSAARARDICGRCDVQVTCLRYALAHPELDGVWGGHTEAERRRIRVRAS